MIQKPNPKAKKSESLGYPALEALLEEKTPDLSGLFARQKQLQDLAKKAKLAKEKAAASQALLAYDRFLDSLFKSLLDLKLKMIKDASQKTQKVVKKK